MATYTYDKVSDLAKFPPPEGSYVGTFFVPGNPAVVGNVEVTDAYITDSNGKIRLVDFKELLLKPLFAKKGYMTLEERSSSSTVMIAGIAFAAALALLLLRKKGA